MFLGVSSESLPLKRIASDCNARLLSVCCAGLASRGTAGRQTEENVSLWTFHLCLHLLSAEGLKASRGSGLFPARHAMKVKKYFQGGFWEVKIRRAGSFYFERVTHDFGDLISTLGEMLDTSCLRCLICSSHLSVSHWLQLCLIGCTCV